MALVDNLHGLWVCIYIYMERRKNVRRISLGGVVVVVASCGGASPSCSKSVRFLLGMEWRKKKNVI